MTLHVFPTLAAARAWEHGGVIRVSSTRPVKAEAVLLMTETGCADWQWHGDQAPSLAKLIAPNRTQTPAYEGHRPWGRHGCEVWIPVIDPMDTLPLVLALLRAQSARPYIVLVDTGSTPEQWEQVQALRALDVEVHALHTGGMRHSSAVVASALDLAVSVCRQEHLIFTHQDCFLRRVTAVEELCALIEQYTAVGYGITPRPGVDNWKTMLGHVWAGLFVPVIRQTRARFGHTDGTQAEWDTEYSFNCGLAREGITPHLLGWEENWQRNITPDYDHVRSWPLGKLYRPDHVASHRDVMAEAMREGWGRVKLWQDA